MFITSTEWRPIDGELISVDLNSDGVAAGIFVGVSDRTIATEYGTQFEVPNARLVRWVDHGRLAVLTDSMICIYGIDGAPGLVVAVSKHVELLLASESMLVTTTYVYQSEEFADGLSAFHLNGEAFYHHNGYAKGRSIWSTYAASWTGDGRIACLNSNGEFQVINPISLDVEVFEVPGTLRMATNVQAHDSSSPIFRGMSDDPNALVVWDISSGDVRKVRELPPGLHALRGGGFIRPSPQGYEEIQPLRACRP